MKLVFLALLGYAIGGIPTGIWLCRIVKGEDPRDSGSGTSGATNVSRVLGKKWAIVVLIVDALKGYLPVRFLVPALAEPSQIALAGAVMAVCLVMGHIWTPYAGFRGGKGVATAAGAMAAMDPFALLLAFGVWLIVFLLGRIVSVASLSAVLALPMIMLILRNRPAEILIAVIAIALLLFYTHRGNLARLMRGEEKKLF
jgi:acyl phosphate:glycerol-3-phosphate acyltransferase